MSYQYIDVRLQPLTTNHNEDDGLLCTKYAQNTHRRRLRTVILPRLPSTKPAAVNLMGQAPAQPLGEYPPR